MTPLGLMRAWEAHHGALKPEHQREFLSRPEVVQILEYSKAAIEFHLPFHPRLKRLLQRLRMDGRAAVKKTPPRPRTAGETRNPPRGMAQSVGSGVKGLKQPNYPNFERTKSKSERPNRGEMDRLRKIVQENRWWE